MKLKEWLTVSRMKTNQRFLRRRRRIEQRLQPLQHLAQHDIVLQEFFVDFGKASGQPPGTQLFIRSTEASPGP